MTVHRETVMLYRFNAVFHQDGLGACENCGFDLGARAWLLLGKGVNPDSFFRQNGALCAECALMGLGEGHEQWSVRPIR